MKLGDHLDYTMVAEPWTILTLADGTTIKLRIIVTDVVVGHGVDPNGHPNIVVQSMTAIATIWPDSDASGHRDELSDPYVRVN